VTFGQYCYWTSPAVFENRGVMVPVGSGVGEAYEDISTVVLGVLQAELGTAPATEDSENMMQINCFF
jgi:hypothetical protein